jgi:coenzyme F420-dependent glucose-6-phosphate dehydrogenase
VIELGYKASAEQFPPGRLLDLAVRAEAVGLDSVAVSDHFQPFRHNGGHSPNALVWLGAVAASTERIRLGTSVTAPAYRMQPAVIAQAFATLACLAEGRVWLGVGTGESLNEVPATGQDWPKFSERLGRLEESVELIRTLWREDRVTFDGRYYRTRLATIYDKPAEPPKLLVAASGPKAATFAGRAGDGFITTSGKPPELYADSLLPAVEQGARDAGRDPATQERMLEVKVAYHPDLDQARRDCDFWAPLALPAEAKHSTEDPLELEKLADENLELAPSRFIVTNDPAVVVDKVRPYVELGFRHLVFHSPAEDQEGFLDRFTAEVVPALRKAYS